MPLLTVPWLLFPAENSIHVNIFRAKRYFFIFFIIYILVGNNAEATRDNPVIVFDV